MREFIGLSLALVFFEIAFSNVGITAILALILLVGIAKERFLWELELTQLEYC